MADRDWGAELEPDCLQDLPVQPGREVPLEQVDGSDIDQLRGALEVASTSGAKPAGASR